MSALIWNEGMSVGIDAIDAEHKKIIAILAKLTSVQTCKISKEIIETIFAELEDYVGQHFAREEALLESIDYPELEPHKKSHQVFIKKLPQLKEQWITEDNIVTSEKITTFLHKWVVNHILVDDLDYVPAVYKHVKKINNTAEKSQTKNCKKSLVSKAISWRNSTSLFFSKKIKLSKRVFITTLMPVIAVFTLFFIILLDNFQPYKNMALVLGLNSVIKQVNEITHSLQAERGLSGDVTSANYQYFSPSLAERRILTDNAINTFENLLDSELAPEVQNNIKHYLADSKNYFAQLVEYRQLIDKEAVDFGQTYHTYTHFINSLLSISEHLIHVDVNSPLANDLSAISSVLLLKEYMGQIRALGMSRVVGENNDFYSNKTISLLVGKQLNALHVFQYTASAEQQKRCADYCDAKIYKQLLEKNFVRVMQDYPVEERGMHWFNYMSSEIGNLKRVSDELSQALNTKAIQEKERLKQYYFLILVILSILLLVALLFSLILNDSIIHPVRKITHALNHMAKGQRNIYLKDVVANDEIGDMQMAYEKLRRKLLQADVFQAIVDHQKDVIEYQKSRQAHFENLAFTDALTGAVNRHQFNQLMSEEITKANTFNQPLSILLLDIDYFKKINDSFGHGVGDEVLVKFYQACKDAVRVNDVVARIGGEEFVIILPQTHVNSAFQFAERLRKNIQQLGLIIDENLIEVTVSIGVSQWQKSLFSTAEEFIADADRLLYQAKDRGRNQVVAE
ncbi:MAG: bacteriohemerythrin [Colwellia sp.]